MSVGHEEQDDFAARMQRLGELIEEIEATHEPRVVEPARELLRAVLAVHEGGLRALLAALRIAAGEDGARWLDAACSDPGVASLLLMHALHPAPLVERVERALTQANAAAQASAHAELVEVTTERVVIDLHLAGTTAADGAAGTRLRRSLEALLCELAPDAAVTLRGGELPRTEALIPASRLIARIGGAQR